RGRARVLARDLRLQSAPLRFYAQTLSPTARHEQASAGNRLYVSSRAMTYVQAKRAGASCSGPFRCSLVCSSSRFLHLLVLAQEFERLLELRIFGLLLGRGSFGRNLVLVSGLRLRARDSVVVVAGQIVRVNRFGQLRPFDFDRRHDACAEERLAVARCPLNDRKQQTIAIAQREELLLRARAETLLADHIAALALDERRGDDFGCACRAAINNSDDGAVEDRQLWIGR